MKMDGAVHFTVAHARVKETIVRKLSCYKRASKEYHAAWFLSIRSGAVLNHRCATVGSLFDAIGGGDG
jgi:hypothetical protein